MWNTLYNILLTPVWLALSLATPFLGKEFRERTGHATVEKSNRVLWIHCASVGELSAVSGLVDQIKRNEPNSTVVISTATVTGKRRASELFPGTTTFIAPIDFPLFVLNSLTRIAPEVLFIIETELWPNLISLAHRRGVTVVVLNGRLTARSVRRYLLLKAFFSGVLRCVDWFFVQTDSDRTAFQELGAPMDRISVTGTMKSDLSFVPEERETLLDAFAIPAAARVFVAGSVRSEEEEEVVRALAQVADEIQPVYFVVAPRHLERAQYLARRAEEMGMKVRFRSDGSEYAGENLLVLDTLGELMRLYGVAHASFIGGSLRPYGGHNVLEPAMWGVPVLFGKFTANCAEEAEELVRLGGGLRVSGWSDLANKAAALLRDEELRCEMGRNALKVVRTRSGVSARVYEMLRQKGYLGRSIDERQGS